MIQIPQSTSRVVMLKLFLTGTTTAATGKTLAIVLSKAGGSFANPNAGAVNATEITNGWYKFTADTTDTGTLGDLVVRGTASGCDDSERIFGVVSAVNGGLTGILTASQIATGVWQDATSGDFTASSSIGKALYLNAVPGAAGGHFIAGTNAATTVTTAFTTTFTGNLTGNVASVSGGVGGSVGSVAGNVAGNVVGSVGSVAGDVQGDLQGSVGGGMSGDVQGSVLGNVTGTIGGFTTAALAQFFTTNTGKVYDPDAVAGSVVFEITSNTSGGGGGATASQIWAYLTSNISTSGSIGKFLKDSLALRGDATGLATNLGGMVEQTWRKEFHKTDQDKDTGNFDLYADDNTTVILRSAYTVSAGHVVVNTGAAP